jgi:hypothetical protein
MIKLLLIFFLCPFASTVFSQSTILPGEWTSGKNSKDTIFLFKRPNVSEDAGNYLSKPCEFQDTTFYWHFRDRHLLEIEVVIRSCSGNWKQKLDSDSLSSDKSILTEYKSITVSPKETRLSLWDKELGEWKINKNIVEITKTKTFNGVYYLLSTGERHDLKLIKQRASR